MKYKLNDKEEVDMFELTGGMRGPYMISLSALLGIFALLGTESLGMNFLGYTSPHWCQVERLANFSFRQQRLISIPEEGDGSYSSCRYYKLDYDNLTDEELINWRKEDWVTNTTETLGCQDWVYDRSVFKSTFTDKFNLVCSRSWMAQLLSTLYMAGVLIGAVTSGIISDRFGRKITIYAFLILKIASGFLTTFAPNYPVLIIARLLLGLGSTGVYLTCFVLVMELSSGKWRTILGTVYFQLFSLGYLVWSGVAYAIRDDVRMQLAMSVPLVITLLVWRPLDESPRWFLLNQRTEEVEMLYRKIADINKAQLPHNFSVANIIKEAETSDSGTCCDMMRSRKLCGRTFILYLHWFTDSLMYYALSLNTAALAGSVFTNTIISGAVEIPANLLCLLGLRWKVTGRRLTCSLSLLVAGIASFISVPLILNDYGTANTALSMVGKAFVTVGFSGIYIYSTELFPTSVRNVGLGTSSMCARISGMAAPYMGAPLASVWGPLPNVIFGVLATASGLLTLLLPETLGRELPDTIEEAEQMTRNNAVMATDDVELPKQSKIGTDAS